MEVFMDANDLTVVFTLYPGFTGLDLVGPHEVLVRCGSRCLFAAVSLEPVASERGLRVLPDVTFADCPQADVLFVPGGPGQTPAMNDEALIAFLARQSAAARRTVSVCTGALLLAQAGVLRGRRATTHWLAMRQLGRLGALPTRERVVWDGPVVSGAGVSAGIDLALALVAELRGPETAQRIQLAIEYDPRPPFDAGAPDKAPPAIVEELRQASRFQPQTDL
jgi:transcriptional regulator GlxA family with amidase domain